jgi:ATP-dependent DNA ligase
MTRNAFLDACAARDLRVLGVEGFYVEGEAVRADMSRIADFSSVTDDRESIDEAKRFVDAVATPGLMLYFTLDSE